MGIPTSNPNPRIRGGGRNRENQWNISGTALVSAASRLEGEDLMTVSWSAISLVWAQTETGESLA
jgi:hypothetical protein